MQRNEMKPGHRLMGVGLAAALAAPGAALAMPDWNLQPPVTPIARQMFDLHRSSSGSASSSSSACSA